MTVSIIDRSGDLSVKQRSDLERRLLFALSRFDPRIRRVSLVIADVDGPRGAQKWCRVAIRMRRCRDVVVTDQDQDLATCVSRVAERSGRAVGLAVEQAGRSRRQPARYSRRSASV